MRTTLLLAALGISLAGCANLDEPNFCKTVQDLPVSPSTTNSDSQVIPLVVDVRHELSDLDVRSGRGFLTTVALTPHDGVDNLDFLKHVTLAFDDSGTALVDYAGVMSDQGGPTEIPGTGAELFPAALDGPLNLQLTLQGAMPQTSWHLDARVCIAVHARVTP